MTKRRLRQFENLTRELEEELVRLRKERERKSRNEEALGVRCIFGYPELEAVEARVRELLGSRAAELAEMRFWVEGIEDSATRRAFKLRFIDGLSWSDVARKLGYVSESGPRMLCNRELERQDISGS